MANLDLKRMKLELVRVSAAKAEQEFKIEEYLEQIERLREIVRVQAEKEAEIQNQIKSLENPA